MVREEQILKDLSALSPRARRLVVDFISFLKGRYVYKGGKESSISLKDEPFIGIWQNRKDLIESVKWVRTVRKREWERNV